MHYIFLLFVSGCNRLVENEEYRNKEVKTTLSVQHGMKYKIASTSYQFK